MNLAMVLVISVFCKSSKVRGYLAKELEKYSPKSDIPPPLVLTGLEKVMIHKALTCPQFKGRIREPKTRKYIRDAYKGLMGKIKEAVKE